LGTGSSSSPELAAALHRLRSTLARMKAELELAESDGELALAGRLRDGLSEALELLGLVESLLFRVVPVLVLDDDERLGELTARGLRRLGYEAESAASVRKLRPGEIVVLDLSLSASLRPDERAILIASRPIVVTGAADPASRAMADELGASDYLVKPVDLGGLVAAIQRRVELKL
jgi:CheY-like chemotaxis protein